MSFFTTNCRSNSVFAVIVSAAAILTPVTAHGEVELIKIGDPLFEPVGFATGSARMSNSPQDGPHFHAMSGEVMTTALGDKHVLTDDPDSDLFLPGLPHSGPYDLEVREAFAASGIILTDVITASEVRGRNYFAKAHVLVPTENAPLGDTPDGTSVPVLPDDIFPITWDSEWWQNGEDVGPGNDPDPFTALSDLGPITDENGELRDFGDLQWSHRIDWGGLAHFANTPTAEIIGDWSNHIELRDANGDGWDVIERWEVVSRRSRIAGDLSHNGELDMHDLRILNQNVAVDAINLRLDMNDDETVNVDDVHFWVTDLKNTWIGDANLDGEFNSGDFVEIFTAGKYETDELALWSEGDWNADERFDSSDFVVAFQGGGYEIGQRVSVSSVPEPSGLVGLLPLGFLAFRARSRHFLE